MDDEDQIEPVEADYATQLAGEAVRSLEQLFEDCPEDHKPRFVAHVREWVVGQYDD